MDAETLSSGWLSHAAAALAGAAPGFGAWFLKLRESKRDDGNVAFGELQEVVTILRQEIDRMKGEIRELRAQGEELRSQGEDLRLRAEDGERLSRQYRDELHDLKNWMQTNNWPLPPQRLPGGNR